MSDDARIEDLRRRIRKDPASIAFGQLAEELRRAGRHREAVTVCRTGLASYPAYLSARVTLGRALIALDHLDDAERELEHVRSSAPENLVAVRALAELRARRAERAAKEAEESGRPATSDGPGALAGQSPIDPVAYRRMTRTVAALESWLAAIYVTRAERRA